MPDEEIDLLRSVLARAHEEPQPFLLRLILAAKDRVRSRTRQRSIPDTAKSIKCYPSNSPEKLGRVRSSEISYDTKTLTASPSPQ